MSCDVKGMMEQPLLSGEKSGVQKQIKERQPKAVYTHFAGHSLNLVIVSSCSVPPVQNCIDQIKSMKSSFMGIP